MKFVTTLFFIFVTTLAQAQECVTAQELQPHTVQILHEGRGVGTGILIDNTHVLTAAHVLRRSNPSRIWVRQGSNPYVLHHASLTKNAADADLSLLTIHPTSEAHITGLKSLKLDVLELDEPVMLLGYAFGQLTRYGGVKGTYKGVQQTTQQQAMAARVTLTAPAYGGDSGGPLFTCQGDLAGIEFGNRAQDGKPEEAYFVTAHSIHDLWVLGHK